MQAISTTCKTRNLSARPDQGSIEGSQGSCLPSARTFDISQWSYRDFKLEDQRSKERLHRDIKRASTTLTKQLRQLQRFPVGRKDRRFVSQLKEVVTVAERLYNHCNRLEGYFLLRVLESRAGEEAALATKAYKRESRFWIAQQTPITEFENWYRALPPSDRAFVRDTVPQIAPYLDLNEQYTSVDPLIFRKCLSDHSALERKHREWVDNLSIPAEGGSLRVADVIVNYDYLDEPGARSEILQGCDRLIMENPDPFWGPFTAGVELLDMFHRSNENGTDLVEMIERSQGVSSEQQSALKTALEERIDFSRYLELKGRIQGLAEIDTASLTTPTLTEQCPYSVDEVFDEITGVIRAVGGEDIARHMVDMIHQGRVVATASLEKVLQGRVVFVPSTLGSFALVPPIERVGALSTIAFEMGRFFYTELLRLNRKSPLAMEPNPPFWVLSADLIRLKMFSGLMKRERNPRIRAMLAASRLDRFYKTVGSQFLKREIQRKGYEVAGKRGKFHTFAEEIPKVMRTVYGADVNVQSVGMLLPCFDEAMLSVRQRFLSYIIGSLDAAFVEWRLEEDPSYAKRLVRALVGDEPLHVCRERIYAGFSPEEVYQISFDQRDKDLTLLEEALEDLGSL